MKLVNSFVSGASEEVLRERMTDHLTKNGYRLVSSQPALTFQRGSRFGSMTAFTPRGWKATVVVGFTANIERETQVSVMLDVDTTGQLVLEREKKFWQSEFDAMVKAVSLEVFQSRMGEQSSGALPAASPDASQMVLIQKKLALEAAIKNGVSWFFWIGGLSIINTIIYFLNGSLTFVVGLGITQLVDGFAAGMATRAGANANLVQMVGFVVDIAIAGVFIAAGILGLKRYRWAIIAGMVLYALDTVIFVVFEVWLGLAFHALALFGLLRGLLSINQLKKLEESSPVPIPSLTVTPVVTPVTTSGLSRALGRVLLGFFALVAIAVVIILIAMN